MPTSVYFARSSFSYFTCLSIALHWHTSNFCLKDYNSVFSPLEIGNNYALSHYYFIVAHATTSITQWKNVKHMLRERRKSYSYAN
jgi:hypothetical protein